MLKTISQMLDEKLHDLYKGMWCSYSRCRECNRYIYRDDLEQVWCGCTQSDFQRHSKDQHGNHLHVLVVDTKDPDRRIGVLAGIVALP